MTEKFIVKQTRTRTPYLTSEEVVEVKGVYDTREEAERKARYTSAWIEAVEV